MLENQQHPAIESPEHPNDSSLVDDDSMETIHLVDNAVHLQRDVSLVKSQEIDEKNKRPCKGKKK